MRRIEHSKQVPLLYHCAILHNAVPCSKNEIKPVDKRHRSFYYAQKEYDLQGSIILVCLVILAFMISVPCGYIRQNYTKYSFMWFLLIHIPIPFIVLLRVGAGLSWHYIPLTLAGSVAGQIAGGRFSRRRKQNDKTC